MAHVAHGGGYGPLFWLLTVLPLALLTLYLAARRATNRTDAQPHGAPPWSPWRTASFCTGVALLAVAGLPPMMAWGHHDLRGHMVQHLLLGMYAPLFLALGAPMTLLLRTAPSGLSRALVTVLGTRPARLLVHPATAAVLDMGGMYVLYLTPLYAWSAVSPVGHLFVHVHFVIAGYLFAWSIAGPDPARHRPGMRTRLAVLFVASAAHAVLGKIMYGHGFPRGTAASAQELEAAALWMYYGGDAAALLLTAALFSAWFRVRPGAVQGDARL